MSITPRLQELLDGRGVSYAVVTHPPAFTATETAHALHLPGREVAKVVVIRQAGALALVVLPAGARVDLERLGAALREEVALAPEREVAAAFPDCETGAMPPFGNLYGLRTYVDESLTRDRQIAFNAGTHTEAVRMSFEDYRRLAEPVVLWLADQPGGVAG